MAKVIKTEKPFLIIECTAGELMRAVGTQRCICDWCARECATTEKGCYIAVLNQWFCSGCFRQWLETAHYYPEDADVESRNFEFYAHRLGINVSKC